MIKRMPTQFIAVTAAFMLAVGGNFQTTSAETPNTAQQDARMAWWREARFGMFIHWGLYALPAGEWNGKPVRGGGEWIMKMGRVPVADYAKLAERFNPEKYDAEQWARAAAGAGMKYIVITAKHHDGFAMWPSKASPFNIGATPFKRDPLKELVEACRRHGIKIGFYYSQNIDWSHPGGGQIYGPPWDPAQNGDAEKYVEEIVIPQVREILSNYGKIDILWWDIPGGVINESRAARISKIVKDLQPEIIMNNRLGSGQKGDIETPEQKIPARGLEGRNWETCMTMNGTWGYKKDDQKWKSTATLIRMLCEIASKGGNYLLNVGPTGEGEIPQASLERLAEIGTWMKVNGEAIYGTTASPFETLPFQGYATQKHGKLYLHVYQWPKEGALDLLVPIRNPVKKATLLAKPGESLPVTVDNGSGVRLSVPVGACGPHVTVVALEIEGAPDVVPISAVGGSPHTK